MVHKAVSLDNKKAHTNAGAIRVLLNNNSASPEGWGLGG